MIVPLSSPDAIIDPSKEIFRQKIEEEWPFKQPL